MRYDENLDPFSDDEEIARVAMEEAIDEREEWLVIPVPPEDDGHPVDTEHFDTWRELRAQGLL